jgi:hypothetical protein
MKLSLVTISILLSTTLFMGCGGDDNKKEESNPRQEQGQEEEQGQVEEEQSQVDKSSTGYLITLLSRV